MASAIKSETPKKCIEKGQTKSDVRQGVVKSSDRSFPNLLDILFTFRQGMVKVAVEGMESLVKGIECGSIESGRWGNVEGTIV